MNLETEGQLCACIGQKAPYFEGAGYQNSEFFNLKLSDYIDRYVVLFFWDRNFTPIAFSQILAFEEFISEFESENSTIIGISPESKFSHFNFCSRPKRQGGLGDLSFALVSDFSRKISELYGALDNNPGGKTAGSYFIIDPKRILRYKSYISAEVGFNVSELLRMIRAFKFYREKGEGCGAGWIPGVKGIKLGVSN